MKLTFLGTGTSQGIPVITCTCDTCTSSDSRDRRLRTSVHICSETTSVVIDPGPDFRQQMLANNVSAVDAILLTHEHNDHIAGIDDVRPYNFVQRRHIPVYGLPRVLTALSERFPYIFDADPYPGAPRLTLHPIQPGDQLTIGDMTFTPFSILHGDLEILGFRMGGLSYITDAKVIPTSSQKTVMESDILVLNALHHKEHHSHFNLEQSIDQIALLRPVTAYLTHISHTMGPTVSWVDRLPENVFSAYDGLSLLF